MGRLLSSARCAVVAIQSWRQGPLRPGCLSSPSDPASTSPRDARDSTVMRLERRSIQPKLRHTQQGDLTSSRARGKISSVEGVNHRSDAQSYETIDSQLQAKPRGASPPVWVGLLAGFADRVKPSQPPDRGAGSSSCAMGPPSRFRFGWADARSPTLTQSSCLS
jgi:hypothetical protein